jgi:hypothetical protein
VDQEGAQVTSGEPAALGEWRGYTR